MSSASINTPNMLITPHGAISLRSLSSMKIVDKCSCYVVGVNKGIANQQTLSSYFGQFGHVKFVRIIQHKIPCEAHIKFDNELSATSAIKWCHHQNISAHNGYYKYCSKFITNKTCKKKNCYSKHSWCDSNDVIIGKHRHNESIKENKTEEMNILQSQFNILQSQYTQQNELIHKLLYQIQSLSLENESLKLENKQMYTQMNNGWTIDPDIDEIVDAVIQNDEQNIFNYNSSSSATSSEFK